MTAATIHPGRPGAPAVHVDDIRLVAKGSLRAFADVSIGALKIFGVRVIEPNGKSPWVSLPQQESTGPDGTKKYRPIIEVPDQIKLAIQTAVLEAWRELEQKEPS